MEDPADFPVPSAPSRILGYQHIDPDAQPHEQIGQEIDSGRGTAYRSHAGVSGKPPYHNYVRCIEQHLEQVGQHQGQAEPDDFSQ